MTTTGSIVLASVIPSTVVILGGLVHILVRVGRNDQRLTTVEHDVNDIRDDLRWLIRRQSGSTAPSERRQP